MNTLKPLVALLLLLNLTVTTKAVPTYRFHYCSNIKNSSYLSNINAVLSSLSSNSTRPSFNRFYNVSSGKPPGEVIQGLCQCRGDLSTDNCQVCVTYAAEDILNLCSNNTGAVIWYDECFLHYSNEPIFSTINTDPRIYMLNDQNVYSPEILDVVKRVVSNLTEIAGEAAKAESKFAVKKTTNNRNLSDVDEFYTFVQCTEDLSYDDCYRCLQEAISKLTTCCYGKIGVRGLLPSCYFRYEIYPFYNKTWVLPPSPSVSVPSPPSAQSAEIDITSVESLQFSLGTIKAATKSFSKDNKLGQDGFGEVYKGTLVDEQEIAVKRLSKHSTQGAKEFKNEVMLVAKLQHRNLAKLLGFCLEREEKILVYEFVPNKSLDYFLFDHEKQQRLDWLQRYKIIKGITRGILYLHEDSRLKIIHRDLKSSNILLDEEMNPKISDFGMARIFGVDQAQASTNRIVGTYGYMSPEYAMRGEFSIKLDVYSFGVLTLEIIAGRKNNSFYQIDGFVDLISYEWKHWKDGKPLEVLDPALAYTYSKNEVMRCIHIGLLCVQEDPNERPTMASVVMMLNGFPVELTSPQQPGFIHGRTEVIMGSPLDSGQGNKNSALWSVDEASITRAYPR